MRVNSKILSFNPLIFSTQTNSRNPFLGDLDSIAEFVGNRDCTCLVVQAFSIHKKSDKNKVERVSEYIRASTKYKNMKLIALCNEEIELEVFRGSGIEACVINQNAFVDEKIFSVQEGSVRFDAIYNGQLKSFKRHYLATQVKSLALLYYGGESDLAYFDEVKKLLSHAEFLNGDPVLIAGNKFKFFSSRDTAAFYNEARVGLCLSAAEGAMYASVEYLLCGLPVVSTRNFGGRDEFASGDYWLTVEDNAESVAGAVAEMKRRGLSRAHVRGETLKRVAVHRSRLSDLMDREFTRLGCPQKRFEYIFNDVFADKMWKSVCELSSFSE